MTTCAILPGFATAYQTLLDECARQTTRLVLVTPPPFEQGGGLLPDLSARNSDLAAYAATIVDLARRGHFPLVDLFGELGSASHREPRLTGDGLQIDAHGHALIAQAWARQLGFASIAKAAGEPDAHGRWPNRTFEELRLLVTAKNRFWFNYWRPENWAFLGGDRTEQPSSRDHRNPEIRWFPVEIEGFVPLIEAKEREIAAMARGLP